MKSKSEPPSLLSKFKLGYEYDNTISEERKQVKQRTKKDGSGK